MAQDGDATQRLSASAMTSRDWAMALNTTASGSPPASLTIISAVSGAIRQQRVRVRAASGSTLDLGHARTTNYWMRNFEVLDWSVIVRYVVSFLCIVLAYNAISGEREGGTLRLALANPVSRAQLLAGKFLAHFATLLVSLALGSLVSLAILVLGQVLELNLTVARSYLFFLGALFK